jgi:hypothetical protein
MTFGARLSPLIFRTPLFVLAILVTMTAAEHLAAYLWRLRGPGVGLAKSHLPQEAWKRREWYAEDGFYIQGQVKRHEAWVERLIQRYRRGKGRLPVTPPIRIER